MLYYHYRPSSMVLSLNQTFHQNVYCDHLFVSGNHSRISINTKNVLIEITATDLHKAEIVLDTLVCAFSEHCQNQFT